MECWEFNICDRSSSCMGTKIVAWQVATDIGQRVQYYTSISWQGFNYKSITSIFFIVLYIDTGDKESNTYVLKINSRP